MEYSVYNSNGFIDVLVRTPFSQLDLLNIGKIRGIDGVYTVGDSEIKVKLQVCRGYEVRALIIKVEQILKFRKIR